MNLDVFSAIFIKLILVVYFLVEYIYHIIDASYKMREFFKVYSLFDFFTIIFLGNFIINLFK